MNAAAATAPLIMPDAFDLRLELLDVTPRVWRVLRVPATLRLDDLHHAIQAVMGWNDFHAHVFEVGDEEYGPAPDEDDEEEDDAALREQSAWAGEDSELTVAGALARSPEGITYIYDFSEEWRVRITREREIADAGVENVICIDGAEAGPQVEVAGIGLFSVEDANRRLMRARRPRATPAQPAGPHAGPERQLLAHLTLVVLMLGSRPTRDGRREAWKTLRPEILESLHDAGLIVNDPQRRSVVLTDAGAAHAERWLRRLRNMPQ